NVSYSGNARFAAIVYRITGAESVSASFETSNTTNPPSLTPGGGSQDTLWIAAATTRSANNNFTAAPASYGSLLNIGNGTNMGNSYVRVASAVRTLTAASENPGNFTASGSNNPHAATIAVLPPPPPVMTGLTANDPDDADSVLSNGDTLTLTFD